MPLKINIQSSNEKEDANQSVTLTSKAFTSFADSLMLYTSYGNGEFESTKIPKNMAQAFLAGFSQKCFEDQDLNRLYKIYIEYRLTSNNEEKEELMAMFKEARDIVTMSSDPQQNIDSKIIDFKQSQYDRNPKDSVLKDQLDYLKNESFFEKYPDIKKLLEKYPDIKKLSEKYPDIKELHEKYPHIANLLAEDPDRQYFEDMSLMIMFIKDNKTFLKKVDLAISVEFYYVGQFEKAFANLGKNEKEGSQNNVNQKNNQQGVLQFILTLLSLFNISALIKRMLSLFPKEESKLAKHTPRKKVPPISSNQLHAPGDPSKKHDNTANRFSTLSQFPSKDSSDGGATDGEDSDDDNNCRSNSTSKNR